jgi:Fe-S cluster assembly protein SufD
MTEATKDVYLATFDQLDRRVAERGQAWTQPLRKAAIRRFAELGFPTTRLEEWKYTNVAPIARIPFRPADEAPSEGMSEALAAAIPGLVSAQLVYVNGHFVPQLSTLPALPQGVEVGCLAQALSSRDSGLEAHLARYAYFDEHAFVALNTAFMQDGAYIHVPR